MRDRACSAVRYFRDMGVRGPLWVTETGYPSRPEHQWDRSLAGGERDQAHWIARGPRELIAGGAARVFVTLRDGPEFGAQSAFASEGVVRWPDLTAAGRAIAKPAFAALRRLALTRMPQLSDGRHAVARSGATRAPPRAPAGRLRRRARRRCAPAGSASSQGTASPVTSIAGRPGTSRRADCQSSRPVAPPPSRYAPAAVVITRLARGSSARPAGSRLSSWWSWEDRVDRPERVRGDRGAGELA